MTWSRIDNFGCNTPTALASLLGISGLYTQGYLWYYDHSTYKSDFEQWLSTARVGIHIGGFGAGWMGIVIGIKMSSDDIDFSILRGGVLQRFCHAVSGGTIVWDYND